MRWPVLVTASPIFSLLTGDERERRRQAGLGNLPGVVAMTKALLQLAPTNPQGPAAVAATRADALRRWLRNQFADAVDDLEIHGPDDGTLPISLLFLHSMSRDKPSSMSSTARASPFTLGPLVRQPPASPLTSSSPWAHSPTGTSASPSVLTSVQLTLPHSSRRLPKPLPACALVSQGNHLVDQ
jgi:hypothetical protein